MMYDCCISDLCSSTTSHETFLLGAAAIANITFMDSQACEVLQQLEAPRVLVQAASTKKALSLFVKDQVGERVYSRAYVIILI